MEFWLAFIIWILGFWTGMRWQAIRIAQRMVEDPSRIRAALREIEQLQREESAGEDEAVRVESVGGQIYVYVAATDEFLAQGTSLEEVLDRIARRFPHRQFRGLIPAEQAKNMAINKSAG